MKKIILFLISGAVLFLLSKCVHVMYSGFKDFPDYATSEVLTEKYPELISDIDDRIINGSTLLRLGASLETVNYPVNTIYVAIEKEEGDDIIIKGEALSGSRSRFIKNGFGYGRLGEQEIIIITRPIDKFGLEDVVVYLKH